MLPVYTKETRTKEMKRQACAWHGIVAGRFRVRAHAGHGIRARAVGVRAHAGHGLASGGLRERACAGHLFRRGWSGYGRVLDTALRLVVCANGRVLGTAFGGGGRGDRKSVV